ncbi:MAG: radical SAM protein [Sedimenticola sp.]
MGRALKLLINRTCNMSCHFCHNEFQGTTSNNEIVSSFNIDKVCLLFDRLNKEHSIENVKISGGEPLLDADLVIALSRAFVDRFNVSPVLLTNLTLANDMLIKKLSVAGIGEIRVNMPSLEPSIYAKHVGGNRIDYETVIKNIKVLMGHEIIIVLNVVVSNLEQIGGGIRSYIKQASGLMGVHRFAFIVNDRLKDKARLSNSLLTELEDLSEMPITRRRERIYQGSYLNNIVTVSSCVNWNVDNCPTQYDSDFYCIPPGIIMPDKVHGRAQA